MPSMWVIPFKRGVIAAKVGNVSDMAQKFFLTPMPGNCPTGREAVVPLGELVTVMPAWRITSV